jgi:adenylylsulfate kinase
MSGLNGFAVWITGMPSSGKSTVAKKLAQAIRGRGLPVVVLESDALRMIVTPDATYKEEERDKFYHELVRIGDVIIKNGVNVIFDATANKRSYRDRARTTIEKFVEVYVQCPLEICKKRDPKGIYRKAAEGRSTTVPGAQSPYEPPERPEVTLDCLTTPKMGPAVIIIDKLKQLLYI